mgnify:CR=1 FL=1
MSEQQTMIEVSEVHFSYGSRPVLNGVSFDLHKGEYVCILGANGCGKTTLLKTMLAFLRPQQGSIRLYGQDVHHMDERSLAKKIAYIPQTHTPPFPFTVRDVVLLGRTPHLSRMCQPTKKDQEIARQAMERLGISAYADRCYTQLSGGQRQKLFIVLALIPQPKVVFLDELTTGLDAKARREVWKILSDLKEKGLTIFLTSHFMDEVEALCDTICILKRGKAVFYGTVEEAIAGSPYDKFEDAYLWYSDEGVSENENI